MLAGLSSCYTSKVYQGDFATVSSAVKKHVDKGKFWDRPALLEYSRYTKTVTWDTVGRKRWRIFVTSGQNYLIVVKQKTWRKTKVKVRGKSTVWFHARQKESEARILEEIDDQVSAR